MTSTQAGRSTVARVVPALALVAVAGACALFVLSTKPIDDPSGTAAGQAASLALPAIFTAGLAVQEFAVGLYDARSGQRLKTADGADSVIVRYTIP